MVSEIASSAIATGVTIALDVVFIILSYRWEDTWLKCFDKAGEWVEGTFSVSHKVQCYILISFLVLISLLYDGSTRTLADNSDRIGDLVTIIAAIYLVAKGVQFHPGQAAKHPWRIPFSQPEITGFTLLFDNHPMSLLNLARRSIVGCAVVSLLTLYLFPGIQVPERGLLQLGDILTILTLIWPLISYIPPPKPELLVEANAA